MTEDGKTPLHIALEHHHFEVAKLLISAGKIYCALCLFVCFELIGDVFM